MYKNRISMIHKDRKTKDYLAMTARNRNLMHGGRVSATEYIAHGSNNGE